jgi:rhodanese-related sulfurtransferase
MDLEALTAHAAARPGGYRDVGPTAVRAHLARMHVVDVREPHEFVGPLGHVAGAELVPLSSLVEAAAGWDRDRPLLLVCRSGARSARAATALAQLGFRNLYNLAGGMLAWDADRLPVERG